MNLEAPTQTINNLEESVPIPKQSLELNKERAEAWIETESDPEIKAIKRKIIEHIQHIDFNEFQEKSRDTINKAVRSLITENNKYAVFFDHKPHASKRWMYELNKDIYDLYPPTEAGNFTPQWEKMSGNIRLRKLIESGVNTFVISDDAAYSGGQVIKKQVEPIVNFYKTEGVQGKPKFVFAIPFVTSRFLKLAEGLKEKYECEIEIHTSTTIPSLAEILTAEDIKTLQDKRNGSLEQNESEPMYLDATVTYFDHRVADQYSFSSEIQKVLDLSAPKPYSNEDTDYFKKEEDEFEKYKNLVAPKGGEN